MAHTVACQHPRSGRLLRHRGRKVKSGWHVSRHPDREWAGPDVNHLVQFHLKVFVASQYSIGQHNTVTEVILRTAKYRLNVTADQGKRVIFEECYSIVIIWRFLPLYPLQLRSPKQTNDRTFNQWSSTQTQLKFSLASTMEELKNSHANELAFNCWSSVELQLYANMRVECGLNASWKCHCWISVEFQPAFNSR